jgi:type I restriction enzyme S subunit
VTTQIMKLGDVCHTFTGGTPSRTKPEYFGGGIPWVKITDLLQGVVIATGESVSSAGILNSSAKLLPVGTVLISIFATIGRTAVLGIEAATNQAIAGVVPHDTAQLEPQYLRYYLDSQHGYLNREARGVAQPNINQGILKNLDIPIPSLPEQHRIVDLLSRAEGIVRLRREAEKKAAEIIPALFNDMFGDPATNPKGWPTEALETVTKIISGATKGRRFDPGEAIELPYMRVGNVKDGYLDLTEIKTIVVKRGEVEKYRLVPGDLLLTEGGDPDKLGRGTLWAGEIETCLHQNHIFKVRADRSKVLPEYLCELVGSRYGKAYFLRVAKKTTGIASINRTQLGQFPVVIPPLARQADFSEKLSGVRSIQSQQSNATAKAQAAFDALLADVFKAT